MLACTHTCCPGGHFLLIMTQVVRNVEVEDGVPPPRSTFQYVRPQQGGDNRPPPALVRAFDSGRVEALESLLPRRRDNTIGGFVNKVCCVLTSDKRADTLSL